MRAIRAAIVPNGFAVLDFLNLASRQNFASEADNKTYFAAGELAMLAARRAFPECWSLASRSAACNCYCWTLKAKNNSISNQPIAATMPGDIIYLDNNATTRIDDLVLEAMLPYLRDLYGNPASGHALGRAARDAVEQARSAVAGLIGSRDGRIVFTASATEANNLAIDGLLAAARRPTWSLR